jgi:hypothetical protein
LFFQNVSDSHEDSKARRFFATEFTEVTEANFRLHRIKRASPAVWETALCSKPLAVLEASFCAQS